MKIFSCEIHQITRGSALLFAIYLMYRFSTKKQDPIFIGATIMAFFDAYTWWKTSC